MAELVNIEDSVPTPRRPMIPLWSSKLKNRPSHGDDLAMKIAKKNVTEKKVDAASKKTCICSPTNHAGSFRCKFHRTTPQQLYQCPKEDGGSDREVTSVKLELPKFKFGNNKQQFAMAEPVNLEDSVPHPRRPMTALWSSKLNNRPSHGDDLAKKIAKKNMTEKKADSAPKKTCICSPSNHPGSFRCKLHRTTPQQLYQCPKEDGGSDREVTSVKIELPKFKFSNKRVPQLSRFGRASVASKN